MTIVQASSAEAFAPYLPRLALEWEARFGSVRSRSLEGSLAGIDMSGFTALSERLAGKGRFGAEELIVLISRVYSGLIGISTAHGGDVLKFRGDALLMFFDGSGHEERAARAALAMQAFVREHGEQPSSVGPVRLGMSSGVVSGECHFFLVGACHRELVVCGPAASATLALEDAAATGEVLISARTAAALPPGFVGEARDSAHVLLPAALDDVGEQPSAPKIPADVEQLVPPSLRARLLGGTVEAEHRHAAAAFVKFTGTDELVADLAAAEASLAALADIVSETTSELEVTWLESDIDRDGGKLYLVAGAPWSAGGDEERMLRATRAIVDARVGPPIAIGVHRGPVFAGAIGSPERRTYAVMGDTVNLAARLTARAEQGEVLATADVLERSRSRFSAEPRQFLMKGKARPVTGYSLGALAEATPAQERERLALVDRQAELPKIVAAIDAARIRQSRAIELVGEPGIGKSRLIEELQSLAVGFQQLEARCEQYAAATPFAPLQPMLRPLVGILPDETPAVAGQKLTSFVATVMPDLAPWLPLIALPFDADVESTPEVDEIDPAFRRDRLHDVLEQMLARVLLMPTTLLVEDAHWMDDASQLLVRRLAQPAARPWLICITRRPGGAAIVGEPATILELEPLPKDDARLLALAAAGEEALSEEQLDDLTARAGGNPLFVRELVATPALDDSLPESVETLLTARLDTLSPEDRMLLRHAAVLGRAFDLDLLAEILPDEDSADPERWLRLGEFVEWDGDNLRFRHDLVRAAAYEGLSFAVRREIHRRIGEALERRAGDAETIAPLLSLHFSEAGEFDRAWAYSVAAGDSARAKYANVDAAIFYERALVAAEELTSDAVAVSPVAEALGDVYELTARYEPAVVAYEHAETGMDDTTSRARLLRKRGILCERTGRYDDALALYTHGLALVDAHETELAELANATAVVLYRQGKLEDCVAWTERAITHAKSADDRKGLARAYYVRGAAEGDLGGPAREFLELALPIFEELGDLVSVGVVLNNMGIPAHYEGKWDEAVARYRAGREASRRAGDVVRAATAMGNEAEILLDQGHLEQAAELFTDALRVQRAAGFAFGVGAATANLGVIAARQGSFDEARRLLAEARTQFEEIGAGSFALHMRVREAEALVLEGQHTEAIELAKATGAALAAAGEVGVHNAQIERLIGYALVQARRPDEARAHLEESVRIARELNAAYEEALTLKALADTQLGGPADSASARRILDGLGVVTVPVVPLP
ncbi:MAG: tetratricopeptide repeat protein [Actinomycetia bacterium]|nr:tetratricopeptide repeat protein [Actinomycetes bacterium]